jgi:small redox-active disulfide protein 2
MSVKIKILGMGCSKCESLYENTVQAAEQLGAMGSVEVEKVKDIQEIQDYGVAITPALVINDEVKSSGRIPSVSDLVSWITAELGK